jgi:UDPglucose--hexose-1-phosphate uridylyltransferase
MVPSDVRRRHEIARAYYERTGRLLYDDILAEELHRAQGIVIAGERFVALQPFAALASHETWILPRHHQACFGDADDDVLRDLAGLLRDLLAGFRQLLDDPPYNLVVHSAAPGNGDAGWLPWHVRIRPSLSMPAGFEMATGMSVSPAPTEETAPVLRAAIDRARELRSRT